MPLSNEQEIRLAQENTERRLRGEPEVSARTEQAAQRTAAAWIKIRGSVLGALSVARVEWHAFSDAGRPKWLIRTREILEAKAKGKH